MPYGTITSTENTFGTVNGALSGTVAGTLTGSVGVPGPVGPQGQQGIQGPPGPPGVGGAWGSIVGTLSAQTDLWTELGTKYLASNPAGYQTAAQVSSALSPYLLSSTASATYQTLAGMSSYLTTSAAASTYYPLTGNPSSFLTASALTGYATQSWVSAGFAPLARAVPSAGTTGQVLTKNSGTDYDASWATFIPGDRYLTTSSTSNTIGNGTKTFTVGTGLSYTTQQDIVIAYDASNHMHALVTSYDSGTGVLVADVQLHSGSGTYTSWTVNVGGTTPLQTVEWGEILGVLGDQTDLSTALNSKLESSTAATIYAALTGATFTGEVVTPASTTSNAGLQIVPGVAPSAPVNGEIWATTNDLQIRLNGATETIAEQSWVTAQGYITSSALTPYLLSSTASTTYAALAGATFTGKINTPAVTTASAFLNLPHGAAPTSPVNGDIWTTTTGLFMRQNGATQQYVSLSETQTISGNKTFSNANLTLGNSTAAGTINVGTGATVSGSTRTINIGTASAAGSTNAINIGGGSGTSTVTFGGNIGGTFTRTGGKTNFAAPAAGYASVNFAGGSDPTTLAAGDLWYDNIANKLKLFSSFASPLATENYISGLASNSAPIVNGTATAGVSVNFSRADHVHPTDTSRAPLASPALTGTPTSTTAAADTNTTQIATTAFVVGQAGSATPLVDGTAAVGTSLRYARQDHVHPTDTTRAALASPTFTGTPAAPTAAVDTNTTQLATTAFVVAQAAAATPLVDGTAAVGTSTRYARADHVHPTDTTRAPLASPALTGTPTAPTATAGTNTTQIATTAFVTSAVPAVATHTQALQFSSTSAFTNVIDASSQLIAPSVLKIWPSPSNYNGTATSGAGAAAALNLVGYTLTSPSAGVAGNARAFHASTAAELGNMMYGGATNSQINFSRRVSMAFRFSQFPSSTSSVTRVLLGKIHGTAVGDLTSRGIGVKYVPNGANFDFQLQVHNGTTLTSVTSSTQYAGGVADLEVVSDGAGNAVLYLNGAQVASTTGAPTGQTSANPTVFAEIESTSGTANQPVALIGRLYINTLNF